MSAFVAGLSARWAFLTINTSRSRTSQQAKRKDVHFFEGSLIQTATLRRGDEFVWSPAHLNSLRAQRISFRHSVTVQQLRCRRHTCLHPASKEGSQFSLYSGHHTTRCNRLCYRVKTSAANVSVGVVESRTCVLRHQNPVTASPSTTQHSSTSSARRSPPHTTRRLFQEDFQPGAWAVTRIGT